MKKVLKHTFFLLTMAITVAGCSEEIDNEDEESQAKYYYVVGYDGTAEVDDQTGTVKSRGYLFISENMKDSLLANNRIIVDGKYVTGNLLENIIDFPKEAMLGGGCGFTFFPEEYRYAFKAQINSCRPMTEEEALDVPRLTNAMCINPHLHIVQRFKLVVITSISKIQ